MQRPRGPLSTVLDLTRLAWHRGTSAALITRAYLTELGAKSPDVAHQDFWRPAPHLDQSPIVPTFKTASFYVMRNT